MNTSVLATLAAVGACWLAAAAPGGDDIPYSVPKKGWDERWGNHRARVRVEAKADEVGVHLPWRRRDRAADKAVIVVDAATGKPVANVARIEISAEYGRIVFQAPSAGEYHVYFMPFTVRGRHFPKTVYDKPKAAADAAWLKRHALGPAAMPPDKWRALPQAKVIDFQARREFHRRDPMELTATPAEMTRLLAEHSTRPYLLFTEDRRHAIRMTDHVPARWICRRPTGEFRGKADRPVDLADCRLELPLKTRFAKYLMGMGQKGGYRPKELDWRWDQAKHQDSVWIGNVDGGLQCKLKGPNYRWPLVNIHYRHRPLLMPEAWHNSGAGGCRIAAEGAGRVTLTAFGGPRKLAAGEKLHFHFALLITPVKPLDPKVHWQHRYYHRGAPAVENVASTGANIINIHHGNDLNPFINYPFLTDDKLGAYIDAAHKRNLKVKLYYTIRELSNHTAELWALRSLNHEIFADGPGGGYAWLIEHLGGGYSPAWHHPFGNGTWCASISQTGLSRWHNYYIEGLGYLARTLEIDGLYLDEIGYDREIMKRVRRVLDANRSGSLLDLHSWNHFNGRAGYANCLNLYLEHLPYVDSIWIGEGRNYDEPPDHWMVEIAGIPFGVMGEMLQGGGNPWRGMLYGMTSRLPWSGDPRGLWKIWDDFGIQDAEMLGYWSDACPITTGRQDVLVTVYRKKSSALVVVASWHTKAVDCKMKIDWKALGLDPARARLRAPAIDKLQAEGLFKPDQTLPVKPRGGWMLICEETEPK